MEIDSMKKVPSVREFCYWLYPFFVCFLNRVIDEYGESVVAAKRKSCYGC